MPDLTIKVNSFDDLNKSLCSFVKPTDLRIDFLVLHMDIVNLLIISMLIVLLHIMNVIPFAHCVTFVTYVNNNCYIYIYIYIYKYLDFLNDCEYNVLLL